MPGDTANPKKSDNEGDKPGESTARGLRRNAAIAGTPDAATPIAPRIETVGTRYRIKSRVGEGAQGIAYLAEDLDRHDDVIIKRPIKEEVEYAEMLLNEGEIGALVIGHLDKGLVGSEFILPKQGGPATVSTYIDSARPLREAVEGASHLQVLTYFERILHALVACHDDCNVVHRDLSFSNILVREDEVFIIDFAGSALTSKHSALMRNYIDIQRRTRSTIGCPDYMCKKRFDSLLCADPDVDVYTVAILLYEALAQRHPLVPAADRRDVNARGEEERWSMWKAIHSSVAERLHSIVGKTGDAHEATEAQLDIFFTRAIVAQDVSAQESYEMLLQIKQIVLFRDMSPYLSSGALEAEQVLMPGMGARSRPISHNVENSMHMVRANTDARRDGTGASSESMARFGSDTFGAISTMIKPGQITASFISLVLASFVIVAASVLITLILSF